MKAPQQLAVLMGLVLVNGRAIGQPTPGSPYIKPPAGSQPWEYTLTIAGYIVPEGTSYVNPVLAADVRSGDYGNDRGAGVGSELLRCVLTA